MQASSSRFPVFLATYCSSSSRSSAPPPFLGLPCRTCRAKPRGRARAGGRSRALPHFRSTAASSEACYTSPPATRVSEVSRWIRPSAGRQESVRQHAEGPIERIVVPLVAGAASLRSLKLGGCLLPPLHEYSALTMLVLRDIPESTPPAAYEAVFASCPKLQTLHLISCICRSGSGALLQVVVDAPSSEIRELVFDNCKFRWIRLGALPCLESLASLGGTVVFFEYNLIPSLRQCNFALHLGVALEGARQYFAQLLKLELDMFLRCTPNITSLIVRFTGPDRWIVPSSSPLSYLPSLRRLLVADVPSSWDASWPRLFLEMSPSLEILHINIESCWKKPGEEISWQPSELRQHHLKEFVVAGFEGTQRQIYLVNFVVGACTALRHVALFRNGHARGKGLWDWEMVTQPHSWTDEEKDYTVKRIMDGVSSSTAELAFG